jgi:hypothetical protein
MLYFWPLSFRRAYTRIQLCEMELKDDFSHPEWIMMLRYSDCEIGIFRGRGGVHNSEQSYRESFLVIGRYTEQAFQFATTDLGDANRAAFSDTFDPAELK